MYAVKRFGLILLAAMLALPLVHAQNTATWVGGWSTAMIDASILHGNTHKIDALRIGWRRAVDMNDRALRQIAVGLGGRANGYPRETGFDITAASEIMAVLALVFIVPAVWQFGRQD